MKPFNKLMNMLLDNEALITGYNYQKDSYENFYLWNKATKLGRK